MLRLIVLRSLVRFDWNTLLSTLPLQTWVCISDVKFEPTCPAPGPKSDSAGFLMSLAWGCWARKGSSTSGLMLNPAPPGYTHYRLRGGGSDLTPSLLSREPMVVSSPARRRSKALYVILPSIFKILRLILSLGSRSGKRSNFDVSVWRSIGPAISKVFCSKLGLSGLKGLVKIPCEH